MKKFIVAALAAILAFSSCTQELVIIHTNDTHSHFEPLRGGKHSGWGGCIEQAAYVDSVRAARGEDNVLLLHAGDFSQGSSYFSELGGSLEIEMLNALRYDCVTLGNHELDNGIEALCARLKNLECPCICANLDLSPFELGQYVKPYTIIERGGRRIGIIGLESDISTNVSKTTSSRIDQLDNLEVTLKYADLLHDVEKCDLIILLSHAGYDEDQALAPNLRWVDLIIGGHTHTRLDGFTVVRDSRGHKVRIITDGAYGLRMGEITVK